jgi:PAS domain S-box-containing protein
MKNSSPPLPSPLRSAIVRNRPLLWLVVVIALCMAAAIGAYQRYAGQVRANTESLLNSLARARATAVRAHLDERIADAWVFTRRDRLIRALGDGTRPPDAVRKRELLEALQDQATAYGYHNIMVFGRDGQIVAQLRQDNLEAAEREALTNAMTSGRSQSILLHVSPEGIMEYGVVAPIHLPGRSTGVADGALYMVLDTDTRLMPLLRDGVPSESFENMLLQLHGDSAIAISTGNHAGDLIKPFRVSVDAANRLRNTSDAVDFGGIPVIRGVAPVMRTPWAVVAKIDRDEAEAPIRVAASAIAVAFLLLIAFATTVTRNMGRKQRLRAIEEKERLAHRTLRVVQTSTDGFLVLDQEGRITDANDALSAITGYERAELLRLTLADVKVVNQPADVDAALTRIRSGSHERYVSQWRRRDGRIIDLDVSATYLDEESGGRFYAFVRDISESIAARRRLERVNRLYAFLNHAGEALFRTRDRDEAFALVCQISVTEGGFPLAWVGTVDEEHALVHTAVAYGSAADYAKSITVTLDPHLETSQGPGGRCITERRSVVVDDFEGDPSMRPWHAAAREHGLRSSVGLPVLVDGKAVAALMLYDREPAAFDPELVTLLEEISRILGLVLQQIETERQRAAEQERRRRSEERFRIHFEALPIATYVVHEASGQVRRVNRAFINLFGYESYEVPTLQASFERFFADPVYRAQTFEVFRRDLAEVTAGAKPRRSREYTIRCRDGGERLVQAIVTRAGEELIIGWVDLTELRTSQEMLREAQRIARLGSWSYDFRTKTRELSDDTIELFDFDRRRGTEGMMAAAFAPEDLSRLQVEFFRAIREQRVYEVTVPVRTRRGELRHVLIRSRIEYDESGSPLRAVGSAQDVTDQVEAANELARYRDQLEELVARRTEALAAANGQLAQALGEADAANRAKSAFLAVMSHEIRTPLKGVIGMAEVLAQSPLPSRDAEAVRIIRGSATNLLGIIDDILDFSKIEAGRIELEHEDTSLTELLDGVQAALAPMADARGVDVLLYQAPDVPEYIVTDATRLRQICYNLVGNAIKFSGGRSEVRGRVAIRVDIAQTDPLQLRIAVNDNGIGMSDETMSHLFTSFTQAELSTTRRFGGTGLGLAICKRLADLFAGSIVAHSSLGVGSTFTLVLPTTAASRRSDRPLIDVQDVPCVVLRDADMPHEADDVGSYLRYAGASVIIVENLSAATTALHDAPKPAVFIRRAPSVSHGGVGGFSDADVRSLHITEGRRRSARVVAPNLVTLDRYHLRSRSLLRGVAIAAGRASPELLKEEMPVLKVPALRANPVSVEQARATGRLILVAEDDEVNQKVILQQLELLGYAAEVARNGREALEMLEAHPYALLLTDLHMPLMDGYQLTRRIRQNEQQSASDRPLPIVALTANALRGEEARARELGMDAFLTKPVLLNVLKGTLSQWVESSAPALTPTRAMAAISTSDTSLPTLEISVLQGLVGDDPAIIVDFLGDYRSNTSRLATEIRLALTQGDLNTIATAFHKLKSTSRSVGALSLGELSHRIEQAARARDAEAVLRLATGFETELEGVLNALSDATP